MIWKTSLNLEDLTEAELSKERRGLWTRSACPPRKPLGWANADVERQVQDRSGVGGRFWQISPDLLGVLNADGCFERANPAWETVLGWSEAEVCSKSIFELLHPEDRERTRAGFEYLKQGYPILGNVPSYDRTEMLLNTFAWWSEDDGAKAVASWPLAAPGSCYCQSGLRSTTTGGDRRFVQGGGRPGDDNAPHGMASRSCTAYRDADAPCGQAG